MRCCKRSNEGAPRSSSATISPSKIALETGCAAIAFTRAGYCALTSRPRRERSVTAPSSMKARARMPSSFGSKSQSGLSNGPSARAACIGASVRGSSPRSTRDSAARSGGVPRRAGSGSRPLCRSAIVRPEITEESSAISSREGSAASSRCLSSSQLRSSALVRTSAHEPLQLAAAEGDRELAALDALEDARLGLGAVVEGERAVLVGGVGAVVPDDHLARAVLALRDHALEGGVAERVVLRLDREPPLGRVERGPARHRPRGHRAGDLEAQVVVHARGAVLLHDEGERPTRRRLG